MGCDDAERAYYEKLSGCKVDNLSSGLSAADEMALMKKLGALEVENKELKKVTATSSLSSSHCRLAWTSLMVGKPKPPLLSPPLHLQRRRMMMTTTWTSLGLMRRRMTRRRRGSPRRG